ncbi:MAG: ATP-grasp domain-containing protein [Proteobacteria bacterium]|nr:ATP-grasp domain-containing protein [Pseudomonadota bacterium]MBU1639505.1 ATP-grasp domain-containing protein [Pseudomonadota bacterium]
MTSRVLILDGHWNKSVAAIRSLAAHGVKVTVGESSALAAGMLSRYPSRRFTYPAPLKNPTGFLDAVEREVQAIKYDVLLPMELTTLLLLSKERHRFTPHVHFPFAPHEILQQAAGKIAVSKAASATGISAPAGMVVNSDTHADQLIDTLGLPLVLKPDLGEGGRGLFYCHCQTELETALATIHQKGQAYLAQEMVAADGYGLGVSVLMDEEQNVLASFTHQRLREYPLRGGPSTLRQATSHAQAETDAITLLKHLKWQGVAMVEFKVNPQTDRAFFLEINPRFWGSLPLAITAGVDFPVLLYKWAMGHGFERPMSRIGLKMRNFLPGDLLHFVGKRGRVASDFWDLSISDDLFNLRDPGPALGRLISPLVALWDPQLKSVFQKRA